MTFFNDYDWFSLESYRYENFYFQMENQIFNLINWFYLNIGSHLLPQNTVSALIDWLIDVFARAVLPE